jgi:carotenoid cleavage dioxygenase-like enzyme
MSNRTTAKSPPSTNAAENPYLSGNFAPMSSETTAIDLRTRGRIPDELEGRFLRIGPSPIGPRDPALYHGSREPALCTAYACAAGARNGIAAASR